MTTSVRALANRRGRNDRDDDNGRYSDTTSQQSVEESKSGNIARLMWGEFVKQNEPPLRHALMDAIAGAVEQKT